MDQEFVEDCYSIKFSENFEDLNVNKQDPIVVIGYPGEK